MLARGEGFGSNSSLPLLAFSKSSTPLTIILNPINPIPLNPKPGPQAPKPDVCGPSRQGPCKGVFEVLAQRRVCPFLKNHPFYGLYLESYTVTPKRKYLGAYGQSRFDRSDIQHKLHKLCTLNLKPCTLNLKLQIPIPLTPGTVICCRRSPESVCGSGPGGYGSGAFRDGG